MIGILAFGAALVTNPAADAVAPPAEKLVCKRVEEDSTGTRLGRMRRVCRTAADWRILDDETTAAINRTKDKGLFDPNSMPGARGSNCTPAGAQAGRC